MKHKPVYQNDEVKIALMENNIEHIYEALVRLELAIGRSNNEMNEGFNKIDSRIAKIHNQVEQILFLIASSLIVFILSKVFHWF